MRPADVFRSVPWFDGLLLDFVLAFAFFTAVTYAVFGKRFGRRPSVVMVSVSIGLALSGGLVLWERRTGLSLKNLGAWALGAAALVLGVSVIALFLRHRRKQVPAARASRADRDVVEIRHDVSDLYRDRQVGRQLLQGFRDLKERVAFLPERPMDSQAIMKSLQRMLPAEGGLLERLSRLREKVTLLRKGHLDRIRELQDVMKGLPPDARRRASRELSARYDELGLDLRLERLDKKAEAIEKKTRDVLRDAEACLASREYDGLHRMLERAEKLRKHGDKLFEGIDRTEKKLLAVAEQAVRDALPVGSV